MDSGRAELCTPANNLLQSQVGEIAVQAPRNIAGLRLTLAGLSALA